MGPVGPRWTPRWPHEPCYQRIYRLIFLYLWSLNLLINVLSDTQIHTRSPSGTVLTTKWDTFPKFREWLLLHLHSWQGETVAGTNTVLVFDYWHLIRKVFVIHLRLIIKNLTITIWRKILSHLCVFQSLATTDIHSALLYHYIYIAPDSGQQYMKSL